MPAVAMGKKPSMAAVRKYASGQHKLVCACVLCFVNRSACVCVFIGSGGGCTLWCVHVAGHVCVCVCEYLYVQEAFYGHCLHVFDEAAKTGWKNVCFYGVCV